MSGNYYDDFEFGRGKNYSINEVAKMFDITPEYKENKPGEAQNTLCDNSIALKLLNWRPVINLDDYIYNQKPLWTNTFTAEN